MAALTYFTPLKKLKRFFYYTDQPFDHCWLGIAPYSSTPLCEYSGIQMKISWAMPEFGYACTIYVVTILDIRPTVLGRRLLFKGTPPATGLLKSPLRSSSSALAHTPQGRHVKKCPGTFPSFVRNITHIQMSVASLIINFKKGFRALHAFIYFNWNTI